MKPLPPSVLARCAFDGLPLELRDFGVVVVAGCALHHSRIIAEERLPPPQRASFPQPEPARITRPARVRCFNDALVEDYFRKKEQAQGRE
jgi:hypothetical protein